MKKHIKRALALILALTLLTAQVAYASLALGSELVERNVTLASGAALTSNRLWSASKNDMRTENYITYTPGGDVSAMVYSGAYVASLNTLSTAASALNAQGQRVVAGINGGFFNTDGTIVGMLVTDGVVRSLDVANYTLVGIRSDGSFFVDESAVTKYVSWTAADGSAQSVPLAGFNAYRNANYLFGLYLYNNDFSSKVNSGGNNVSVILRPIDSNGNLRMNSSLTLEVVSVTDTFAGDTFNGVIPSGCYMLYAQSQAEQTLLDSLRGLSSGQRLTVSVGSSAQWNDAVYGISTLYTLLRGGEVVPGLGPSVNPYTAIGIKADGTVLLYTIDGRQSGHSVGATHTQVAQRLQELGCVTAVALDGGGSTTIGATLPGHDSFSLLNSPSGGAQRRVNNSFLLTVPAQPTGILAGYYLDSDTQVMLSGSSLPVTAVAYDTAGYSLGGYTAPEWTATGGSVAGSGLTAVYTAGTTAGQYQITASENGMQSTLAIRVVDQLSSLTLSKAGGSKLTSLAPAPGDVVDLTASGTWYNLPVSFAAEDVLWSVEGSIGSINDSGTFTAADTSGATGAILASAGGVSVRIPVTIGRSDPFTDMNGHWASEYVSQLYHLGLTTGVQQADGTYIFLPNGQMSRGELMVFLTRLLEVDTDLYSGVKLPFADADIIPEWVLPSAKAMYALQVLEGSSRNGLLYADVNGLVTRETAMTMLGRMLKDSSTYDLSVFADGGSVSSWASPHVQTLVANGVVEGSNGFLYPAAYIDRASAAKLLVLVSSLEKAEPVPRQSVDAG